MPLRNRPLFLQYDAWNISTNTYIGGDAENHTVLWVKDDEVVEPTNTPVEVTYGGSHVCYGILLTADETQCYSGTLVVRSSTPNVIIPRKHVLFEQILGSGAILVNHDYGGEDALRYVASNGVGIDNATIQIFLKEDYDAGRKGRGYIIAESTTDTEGRWTRDVALDEGEYAVVFFKQGLYAPSVVYITVSNS